MSLTISVFDPLCHSLSLFLSTDVTFEWIVTEFYSNVDSCFEWLAGKNKFHLVEKKQLFNEKQAQTFANEESEHIQK